MSYAILLIKLVTHPHQSTSQWPQVHTRGVNSCDVIITLYDSKYISPAVYTCR